MPNVYRAFPLDEDGAVCKPPIVLAATDDQSATEGAKQLLDGHGLAVWQGERSIAILKRQGPQGR